jgi:hypothetical protein
MYLEQTNRAKDYELQAKNMKDRIASRMCLFERSDVSKAEMNVKNDIYMIIRNAGLSLSE